jgi:hypothetical protein
LHSKCKQQLQINDDQIIHFPSCAPFVRSHEYSEFWKFLCINFYHPQFFLSKTTLNTIQRQLSSNFSTLQILTRVPPRSLHFDLSLSRSHRPIELEFLLLSSKYSKSTKPIIHLTSISNRNEVQTSYLFHFPWKYK